MAYIINLTTRSDKRGNLTVIEKEIPFEIKRIFYIYAFNFITMSASGVTYIVCWLSYVTNPSFAPLGFFTWRIL